MGVKPLPASVASHCTQIRSLLASLAIDLVTAKAEVTVYKLSAAHDCGGRLSGQRLHPMAVVAGCLHVFASEQRLGQDLPLAVPFQRGYGPALATVTGNTAETFNGMTFQNGRMSPQRLGEVLKHGVVIGQMTGDAALDGSVAFQLDLLDLSAQASSPLLLRTRLGQLEGEAIVGFLVALPLLPGGIPHGPDEDKRQDQTGCTEPFFHNKKTSALNGARANFPRANRNSSSDRESKSPAPWSPRFQSESESK